jgi:hypothetical protein
MANNTVLGNDFASSTTIASSTVTTRVQSNGILHGIAVWYKLSLEDGGVNNVINTGPHILQDNNDCQCNSSFWRQAIYLCDAKAVSESEVVSIEVLLDQVMGVYCSFS